MSMSKQNPVVAQPQASGQIPNDWMLVPSAIPNCPRGLEYLTTIDQLLIEQKIHLLEIFTGFEKQNKFKIRNNLGQQVYWAKEESDCCSRQLCGPSRPFEMKILDVAENEIIRFHRPLACQLCCFPCCLQTLDITASGEHLGTVEQEWTFIQPKFRVKNHNNEVVLRIEGVCCQCRCCADINFDILTLDGSKVGQITRKWAGLGRQIFTDADFFSINFPMDLDVRMKACMLGACMLIDVMYFETSGK